MIKYTVEDIMIAQHNPCYPREQIEEAFGDRESITIREIADSTMVRRPK